MLLSNQVLENLLKIIYFEGGIKVKTIGKMLSLMIIVSLILNLSMTVNASISTQFSDIWSSWGASAYSSETSTTVSNESLCYMRLYYFKFNYYPTGSMPPGYYIYSRLYTMSSEKASNLATFDSVTAAGQYNYSFLSGYANAYTTYQLKTNSNLGVSFEAQFY